MGWLDTHYSFSFANYHDPKYMNWGPLRVFNDDVMSPGRGFDEHPHQNMEIITYVLDGKLTHRDSMGNKGAVSKGGIQYMTAGTGVVHAEYNDSNQPVHLVQMWVLPQRNGLKPNYGQKNFKEKDRKNKWLLTASGQPGTLAPVQIHQDASLYIAQLNHNKLEHEFQPHRLGFLFVVEGTITANEEKLQTGDAVRMASQDQLVLEGTGEIVLWDLDT
ncbi:pirin family protein [Candidatus Micrarchaeota archaeon]|nr:pirin family protein [Candidatus Micrarchaeota archaeon]